jgi:uncharacterized protein
MRALFILGWIVLLVLLLWPLLRRLRLPRAAAGRPRAIRDELVKDPVCGTYVVRSRAVTREVGGRTHHFCSRECAARFSGLRGQG